jgi:hypothetical protein
MGEVVSIKKENKGYNIVDEKVSGVFVENIVAIISDDKIDVLIGEKCDEGIENPLQVSMKDMNEFCLMWLLIFNESVIKEDYLDQPT